MRRRFSCSWAWHAAALCCGAAYLQLRALLALLSCGFTCGAEQCGLRAAGPRDEWPVDSFLQFHFSCNILSILSFFFSLAQPFSSNKTEGTFGSAKIALRGTSVWKSHSTVSEWYRYWATCNKACEGLDLLTNHVMGFKKTHTHTCSEISYRITVVECIGRAQTIP